MKAVRLANMNRLRRMSPMRRGSGLAYVLQWPRLSFVAMALVLSSIVLGFAFPVSAAEFKVPRLTGPVVDEAGIISPSTEARIESALRYLHEQGGSQITVLTVPSLEGLTIEQASIQVVDEWKLGGEKTDNGVLLFIAPKDRKLRIEVGQGLEGVLTDADSKRIIEESITPLFKAGDFDSGIIVGVYQIARKTDPGIDLSSYLEGLQRTKARGSGRHSMPGWLILVIIVFFILARIFGGGGRGRGFRGGPYYGGLGGGGWGGGSGGGFGGGSSGGGWSGGGGGFSGGGSSGGW